MPYPACELPETAPVLSWSPPVPRAILGIGESKFLFFYFKKLMTTLRKPGGLEERPRQGRDSKTNVVLLLSVWALQLSIFLIALALYKKGDRSILEYLSASAGLFLLAGLTILLFSGMIVFQQYRNSRRGGSKEFVLTVAMGIATGVGAIGVGEAALRIGTTATPQGQALMGMPLLPLSWSKVVEHNQGLLRRAAAESSIYEYDSLMGWTLGPKRTGRHGLYFTSDEGIRSPSPDVSFAARRPVYRIATVGDSHTFCEDVKYEECWGDYLEGALGTEFQVLNFGVPGYGVDQAYLRYIRDVRPWQPDVVIFGVSPHDVIRITSVYSFVMFPDWDMPFAKPRFIVADGQLSLLNVPVPASGVIFSQDSIFDLPFIQFDGGYNRIEWERRWYHVSHLVRFMISRFPRWPVPNSHVSYEAAKVVTIEIVRTFERLVVESGAVAIIAHIPSRDNLDASSSAGSFTAQVLEEANVGYVDLTACVLQVPAAERFVPTELGGHHAPGANAAMGDCLSQAVMARLIGS